MNNNLVDSCGWVEYFVDGPNADFFELALLDLKRLIVPTICMTEVFKIIYRERGRKVAVQKAMAMQKARVVDLDPSIALSAGLIGVDHKLSLADSIILATARAHNALVWTQDADLKKFDDVKYIAKKHRSGRE